jgi:nitroreductase
MLLVGFSAGRAPADVALPAPETDGGPGVLTAIRTRASATHAGFSDRTISDGDLSTLLWAATGRNRQGSGWTIPLAMGKPPYVDVYVLAKNGSFLYDWEKNALKQTGTENVIGKAGRQSFVASASHVLVFVKNESEQFSRDFGDVAAGAMTQNVYLAATGLGIKGRYVVGMNVDVLRASLGLEKHEKPVCIMPLGYQ